MRALIVSGGVVANTVILPDAAVIAADGKSASWLDADAEGGTHLWAAPDGSTLLASDTADIGWTVKNGKPVAPAVASIVPANAPRTATAYQLMSALTDDQRTVYPTAVKAWDQRLFSARDTPWPEDNIKIGRIAAALGTTPAAWFDAALASS